MKYVNTYDIPEWAIYALEYGTRETEGLTDEDIADIENFTAQFTNGYTMDIKWEETDEFNTHPAFGLPTNTVRVDFYTD